MRSLVLLGHMEFVAKMPVLGMPDPVKSCLVSLKSLYEARLFSQSSIIPIRQGITKALIRLGRCAVWYAPLLFRTYHKVEFPRNSAHIILVTAFITLSGANDDIPAVNPIFGFGKWG